MTQTPQLIVLDETDSPRLRIIQRCVDCNVTVSEHLIDASQYDNETGGAFGARLGTNDGEAWLGHVRPN